jgi:3-oxoacyl-[acyl-carrier protein] reductase
MDLDLSGKRALVCGASAGIGRACAVELALLGASVTVASRDEAKLRGVVASLPTPKGQRHDHWAVDLSSHERVASELASLLREGRAYHILINNTGGPTPSRAIDTTPEAYAAGLESLLLTPQVLAQGLVGAMRSAKYGRIINIASTSVKQPIPALAVSNAIRAATANWAKTLSQELAADGITVNNVLPGYTDTERLTELFAGRAARAGTTPEQVRAEVIASIPMQRLGRAEEIGAVVAFLASPAAAYVSGVNLVVDGARTGSL